ncbi:cupin [Streptomyces sp. SP17BM10]|uniref:cupin domain-containing protein n=1 Tax=Streptomyces sp. SP17BM10 TaxID=3002530 RepID=UPI002E75A9B0|nr:cupin domain-containing protein [Streptomyces sp. SP17BM10]MEE1787801.1 cupin [Streptomyces sp. SP17BM10]
MPVIRHADARRTETPNAVMTTYASPTQCSTALAMWHVDMAARKRGPLHAMDVEQIWTLLSGSASVDLAGETLSVSAGDTVVFPADVARQISTADGFTAVVAGLSPAHAYNPDAVTPEGACALAPKDDERMLPSWIA